MALMALGLFVFDLPTIPYQQLQRSREWRHPANSRIGKRPARQFIGPGAENLTLSGTLHPEITGGRLSLAMLAAMADTGKAWVLIGGDGLYYGLWVIEQIDETHSLFFDDGAARQIDFTLKLSRVDDDDTDLMGMLTAELLSLAK